MYERNRHGRKTEFTRKALVRYILDSKLKQGDRLPSQAELVRIIGTSSSTIIRAVNSLSDEGVLDVRDKVGVFLATNHLVGKIARKIALLTQCTISNISPYYSGLALALIRRLQQNGCQTLIFPWRRDLHKDSDTRSHKEFPGLHDAVKDGEIDIVFDFTGWSGDDYFAKYDIPLLTLGPMQNSANCIIIDMADFCGKAISSLIAENISKIQIISPHEIVSSLVESTIDEICMQKCFARKNCSLLTIPDVKQGRELAKKSLMLQADERPEAFIFMDEFFGLDFINGFAVMNKSDYHPQMVIAYDPDLQLSYPYDNIFLFEKKAHEIADLAVDSLLALSQKKESDLVRYYRYSEIGKKDFFLQ